MNGTSILALNCKYIKNLFKGIYGKWIWHHMVINQNIKNEAIIMFPIYSQKLFECIENNLEVFLNEKGFDAVKVILNKSCKRVFSKRKHINRKINVIFWDRINIEALIQFYLTEDFDKRFIIASLDLPYRRNGSRLIGKRNLTEEEVFLIGVLGLEIL